MSDIVTTDDPELREIQISIAKLDLALKEADLKQKNWSYKHPYGSFGNSVRSPLFIGAVITTLATLGVSLVSLLNANFQRQNEDQRAQAQLELEETKSANLSELEKTKHETALIVNAIEHGAGNPDNTAENIQFYLMLGSSRTISAATIFPNISRTDRLGRVPRGRRRTRTSAIRTRGAFHPVWAEVLADLLPIDVPDFG